MFATVQGLVANYTEAVDAGDAEKILSGYAADVHIFDCFEQGEYEGIEAWRAFVTEWFSGMEKEGAKLRAEVESQTAKECDDSAHVHGIISFAALDQSGQPLRKTKNRFTFVLGKVDGSWRIAHEHSSVPVHMEDGRAIFG